ncbi:histone-fold-containing protein [Pseudovirgaria hyperparasitica]|uniref:Histone-fold-containing protein n=1 Tax=Pseudovirgaria hyperparasitica TaxID=470096 RepID=A0A6A6W0T4_9PEZI|nr:histone-fold-containing protein [Pseudovirgaria hyperparasitica]KAF2756153.1 histone-fold-containing protein [Pseudovirgaria hyperparasitica]
MDPSSIPGQQKMRQQAPRRYDGQNGNPAYKTEHSGHYGASASIAASGHAPDPQLFTGSWANVNQGLNGQYRDILNTYWQHQITKLETEDHDYKIHPLPLARIKKVMKADPEVKMISAEAPILFAKGCDIFITELTMRAWIHAEENKRRTLQRSDIASALIKSDMFDFLIDIVPREDASPHKRTGGQSAPAPAAPAAVQQGVPPMGMHTQQYPMGPPEHMSQHISEQEYKGPPGMFPPGVPDPSAGYPQAQQQMFDQSMYAPYGMQQPQMYSVPQRGPDHSGAQDPQNYRQHDPEADAEGEREDYGP